MDRIKEAFVKRTIQFLLCMYKPNVMYSVGQDYNSQMDMFSVGQHSPVLKTCTSDANKIILYFSYTAPTSLSVPVSLR